MLFVKADKPVKSAVAVAALRAASVKEQRSIANPDYLAHNFVRGIYSLILALPIGISRKLIEKISPGSYCYFLARTQFIDHHFTHAITNNIKQVVILGAGFDTRANRLLNKNDKAIVYEIDLPSTQNDKHEKMRSANIRFNPNVVYIPHDLNGSSLKDILIKNGFSLDQPSLFIFEGISYYLQEKSINDLFSFICQSCAKESSIVFDYSLETFVQGMKDTYGAEKMQNWLRRNNEKFQFGINEGKLKAFLKKYEMSLTEDIGSKEILDRYLKAEDGLTIGQPLGHLRLAHAVYK